MKIRYKALRTAILKSVFAVISETPQVLTLRSMLQSTGWTLKEVNDQTLEIDLDALKIYQDTLGEYLTGTDAIICSEENPSGRRISDSGRLPRLLFIVDPIDNTDGGIHGSPAYTAISLFDIEEDKVIAAAFGDLFRREVYYADEETEAVRVSGQGDEFAFEPISPGDHNDLEGSYVTVYTLKPHRLRALARQQRLLEVLGDKGRIDNFGGSAGLTRVACGYIDAAVEFCKGFQAFDLFPGAYILKRAGGVCISTDGKEVSFSLSISSREDIPPAVKRRQKFIAASTHSLAIQILANLNQQG